MRNIIRLRWCGLKSPKCSFCGGAHYQTWCQRKPNKPIKAKRRIRPVGARELAYRAWRDEVAKPYLDANYGHICAVCGLSDNLHVDHILTRGGHAHLKMDLANVQYLCAGCHSLKHN